MEDYYLGAGEAPGYWLAGGAKDLGLSGTVTEDALRAVLNAKHPSEGHRLIAGKRTKRERVPGFDLTFRAPKSVALLHALGPKEASNQVVSAHDAAVKAALGYLERHASHGRRGAGGKKKIATKGFIGAAFRHRTSRAGDPLLHTHVLVANVLRGEDGKWGALDARHLYLQAKTAGYLYQVQLRAELTRRLGVEWTPATKGYADIEGFSRQVIRAFSKRRGEIEAAVGKDAGESPKAAQTAALMTRKAKDYGVTPEGLLPEWRQRAEGLRLTSKVLGGTLGRAAYRATTDLEVARMHEHLASKDGLTAQTSSFSRREAIQGFCLQLQHGADISEVEALADTFLASDNVIPLAERSEGITATESRRVSDGRGVAAGVAERRYSTPEMLGVEQAVIERAIERRLDGSGIAGEQQLAAALERRPSLFPDQQAMVTRLTTSGLGVEVVVGKAGSGKTFALDAAREAWAASGYRVIGCALAAKAAQELQAGSGIDSYTIRGLLNDLDNPAAGGLSEKSVLVVDEAGMVGTRDLNDLFAHAEAAGAKVVLVGDDRQLQPIDAGGAFSGIKNRLPAIELTEVRRQPFGWERDALELIREGKAKEALDAYTQHDRVTLAPTSEKTRRQLIADWWGAQQGDEPAVIFAARKSEVAELNARARSVMAAAGRLGEVELEIAGVRFAVGDRVMTLHNFTRLGVVNSTRGTVVSVDLGRFEIVIERDEGGLVTLPRSYLEAGHLTHCYAMTGHKAQGMTTDKGFVLGDETLYREWTYVAMSRGKDNNRLYVVAGADPERDEVGGKVASSEDPMQDLIRAIGRSRAKDLALDTYEHEEIRNLSTHELRRDWEAARRVVDDLPPDPAGELKDLRDENGRVETLIRRQTELRNGAERQLGGMGFIARRRQRARVGTLEDRIDKAVEGEIEARGALERLRRQEAELEGRRHKRDAWLLEHAPEIRRLDALGRELWWREQHQALAAEVAMPTYLVRAVGERPMKPSERAAWRESVRAIESYRERWGVKDRQAALGAAEVQGSQKRERDEVQAQITQGRDLSQEREAEVIERFLEL